MSPHFSNGCLLLVCLGLSAFTTGKPGYRRPPKLPMVGSELGWREKADETIAPSLCCACAGWAQAVLRKSQRRVGEDPECLMGMT
jgi:hypothetical protein